MAIPKKLDRRNLEQRDQVLAFLQPRSQVDDSASLSGNPDTLRSRPCRKFPQLIGLPDDHITKPVIRTGQCGDIYFIINDELAIDLTLRQIELHAFVNRRLVLFHSVSTRRVPLKGDFLDVVCASPTIDPMGEARRLLRSGRNPANSLQMLVAREIVLATRDTLANDPEKLPVAAHFLGDRLMRGEDADLHHFT